MLIITKFHDYYDRAMGYGGVDKTTVYQRKEDIIPIKYSHTDDRDLRLYVTQVDKGNYRYCVDTMVVGVAGEVYPVVKCVKKKWVMGEEEEIKYFYGEQELRDWVEQEKLELEKKWYWGDSVYDVFAEDRWEFLKQHFILQRAPIFIYERCNNGPHQIRVNTCLKDVEFYKVRDAFTAFQDIYMYISGVLGNLNKELTDISDIDMRDKKGFDKWSFKQEQAKARKRKK